MAAGDEKLERLVTAARFRLANNTDYRYTTTLSTQVDICCLPPTDPTEIWCTSGRGGHMELWFPAGFFEEYRFTSVATSSPTVWTYLWCTLMCCGICDCCGCCATEKGTLLAPRTFTRQDYRFRCVHCSQMEQDRMFIWCAEHCGLPFNKIGILRVPCYACSRCTDERAYFCSEGVHAALREGGVLARLLVDRDSPSYWLLDANSGSVMPADLMELGIQTANYTENDLRLRPSLASYVDGPRLEYGAGSFTEAIPSGPRPPGPSRS